MLFAKRNCLAGLCLLAGLSLARPAHAYVDLSPTIAKVMSDAQTIALVDVVSLDREKRILTLKERITFKGKAGDAPLTQQVAETPTAIIPRAITQWAQPGARAIVFSSARTAIVCLGQSWYQLKLVGKEWKLGPERPDLAMTYYGTVSRLTQGINQILAGRDAILTMVPHGDSENVGFDLALNRMAYPALVTVQRVRVNLKMPSAVMMVSSNPAYMLGLGPADEEDLPVLIRQLKADDSASRAGAADDIRQLTEILGASHTKSALPALEECLTDSAAPVRTAAAGTLLRITHGHDKSLQVLQTALASPDAATRCNAANAAAVTGKAGQPLVPTLAQLLKDPDESVRYAALQAIGTLGSTALAARDAVIPLLESPEDMITAADALGRMGPRAQPVPPAMTKMLQSDQAGVRMAALRGMSQIGGKEALPAAEYIAREIAGTAEIDAYNMVEYLGLLGPVAAEPASRIRTVPMPNPAVMQAANWAMNAPAGFPWQSNSADFLGSLGDSVFAGFVAALGERLKPCALALAPRIMDNTAGKVPDWGYKILNAAPEESIQTIAPHLQDKNKTMRERAALTLGKMGPAAVSAQPQVQTALAATTDAREKNLLAWCLHQITED